MELFRTKYTEVSNSHDMVISPQNEELCHAPLFCGDMVQPFLLLTKHLLSSILIYLDGMFKQRLPIVTTDPNKLEDHAKSILKPTAFNYVAGGAGERATMDANRLAFRQWKMIPRMLRPTTHRDLKVTLFGETYGVHTQFPTQAPIADYQIRQPSTNGSSGSTINIPRG